ncbi:MAG: YggS family pyridoxal phosphate-dependent enzyme [Lachnospiraceae bacterium]|nr:YggS family pyridoxal phosphate-dependent enzyme [Lachnospiraceae bacterium]
MIKDNICILNEEISAAAKAGRFGQDVTLVAVSKTHPAEMIMEAYDEGIRDFGENKVQELLSKYDELPSDIRWHLIGHLQRNKVKYIVDKVWLIHSVDSLKLAETIEEQAAIHGVDVNILIQVNISHEESKFGIDKDELISLLRAVSIMKHVHVQGLMTIAPFTEDPEECRWIFRELKNLSIDIDALKIDNIRMKILSMGMSGDYRVAIEEGSTMVRVGTAIFGQRDYTII